MDGIHDLGGKQGHGPVLPEANEPTFHARWEAAVFACQRALGAAGITGNIDRFRHAVERIDPQAYLGHSYYGRWLGGLETLAVEAGVLNQAELDAAVATLGGDPIASRASRPASQADRVSADPVAGAKRPLSSSPLFKPGDQITTQQHSVPGHTRLPAYARGRPGTITAWHQGWVYPDSNAHGAGPDPQHLYTVAFRGEDLWGPGAEYGLLVHLDLFEPYLEAAP